MARSLILVLLFALSGVAAPKTAKEAGKFEGVWKAELHGHVYAVVTILSDHPPRGTIARGSATTDAAMDLYIQAPKIVKGALRFKTIDPNDGVVGYEMKVTSPSEASLTIAGAETVTLKRN